MTIIAACVDQDGAVWMGSDCISLHRNVDVKISSRSKVFRLGEMLIGSSGTTRCGQIVAHRITPGAIPDDCDLLAWLVETFVPILRAAMKEHGGEISKDGTLDMDCRLLVGLRGLLFEIDVGYGVLGHKSSLATTGCADKEAQAAMLTALKIHPSMHARQVVQYGMEAAAELDINIRPPSKYSAPIRKLLRGFTRSRKIAADGPIPIHLSKVRLQETARVSNPR